MSNKSELDLKNLLDLCLNNWKWFVLSILFFIFLAVLYLRYTVPEYSAIAKIQVLEESNQVSELSLLQDLDIYSSNKTQIEDEAESLAARDNFIQTVLDLDLNIKYFLIGKIKSSEIYASQDIPFAINFLSNDSIVSTSDADFYIRIIDSTSFGFKDIEEERESIFDFGDKVNTEVGDMILTPKENLSSYVNKQIRVELRPAELVADFLRQKTRIYPNDKKYSNIINISITDAIERRAIDIINKLIDINNTKTILSKKAIADKTSTFIDDRITEIYSNLSSVDKTAENFKTSRGIADLGSQSNVNFNMSAASEQELQNANIQLSIANSMKDLIDGQSGYDIIPEVGLTDQGISTSAQRYNDLVRQRKRLLESSNEKNPVIVKLDQQLEDLKKGMRSSLNNVTNNLNLQVNSLSKQLSQINSRIYAAPGNERALRDISRRQQTTESLYLYLLQKREEAQITFASATPKYNVIDSAYGSIFPVSPKRNAVLLASLILGFLIPFSVLYILDFLDNKIHNKIGLEKIISNKVPILAELPRIRNNEKKLITGKNRSSVLGESLRILRTNLDYIIKKDIKPKKGGIILVTSSVPGEGKSFVSTNLASVLASASRNVLLIGADIRNPKLTSFIVEEIKNGSDKVRDTDKKGLTDYLHNEELEVDEIIQTTNFDDIKIDIVYSGDIPPNPVELLMSPRLKYLFETCSSRYDYVIIDSAPVVSVTDTLLLNDYADHVIYVTRAGKTEQKILDYPLRLIKEKKLKNLSFVVNAVRETNLGYGRKYGYGYGASNKKWWQFYAKA